MDYGSRLTESWNLHLVVTSQWEREIEVAFQELGSWRVDVATESSNHVIEVYLDRELAADRRLRKWDKTVRDEIKSTLMKGARGMYSSILACLRPELGQ